MKRAAPLRRSTRLQRSAMRRRKRKPRPGDDPQYLAFVRSLPCCAPGYCRSPRAFPIEAHHLTGAGMGRKADDRQTMPLCSHHHRALHNFAGAFAGWTREQRADWQRARIAETQALWRARAA